MSNAQPTIHDGEFQLRKVKVANANDVQDDSNLQIVTKISPAKFTALIEFTNYSNFVLPDEKAWEAHLSIDETIFMVLKDTIFVIHSLSHFSEFVNYTVTDHRVFSDENISIETISGETFLETEDNLHMFQTEGSTWSTQGKISEVAK